MATAYTLVLPNPPGVPAPITVRIVAMRDDGKTLSREELEALAAAYPPADDVARAAVEAAIKRARSRPSKPVVKARTKPPAKAASKRKAAKRPARARST